MLWFRFGLVSQIVSFRGVHFMKLFIKWNGDVSNIVLTIFYHVIYVPIGFIQEKERLHLETNKITTLFPPISEGLFLLVRVFLSRLQKYTCTYSSMNYKTLQYHVRWAVHTGVTFL